jgi:hypothetical protein
MITTEAARRCAEKGCRSAALTRRGDRGPRPRRCAEHTESRRRATKHHPVKPKDERYECCDKRKLCRQHRQQRDEFREQSAKELALDSASRIFGLLDAELKAAGIQIVIPGEGPKFWRTHYGPWEGRTSEKIETPDLEHDKDARAFYGANPGWHKARRSVRGDWPPMWSTCLPPAVFLALFCAALEGEKYPVLSGRYGYELAF